MARLEERRWEGDPSGSTRRDRRAGRYSVYLPDPLVGRRFALDGAVAADVARAEVALARFEERGAVIAGGEGIARLLRRAEAMASSRIEGLVIGGRRLLRMAAARRLGDSPWDPTANEVLGNVEAMEWGIAAVTPGGEIRGEAVLEAHRRLVTGTRIEEHGGVLRRVQALQSAWRARIGPVRRDSAAVRLIEALPSAPVLTAATAAGLVERSFQATTLAMDRLVDAGVLVRVNVGRRNRAFEAPELIDAFNALERRLAAPVADTRLSAPAGRVPE